MIVKVSGMTDVSNIREVVAAGADWLGLEFCSLSPRNVTMIPTCAGIIPDRAPALSEGAQVQGQKLVGCFTDEMAQNVVTRVVNFKLDMVQMDGTEPPTLIRNLRRTLDPDIRPGIRFVKTIRVSCREDIAAYKPYADCVDYLLFKLCPADDGSGSLPGWEVLSDYDGELPFLVGGAIGPDDAERVKALRHDKFVGIDLAECFEKAPGSIDVDALRGFVEEVKGL